MFIILLILVESPPTDYCSCNSRCATKRCICKSRGKPCGKLCHPGKSCCNKVDNQQSTKAVDLTKIEHDDAGNEPNNWVKIQDLILYAADKEMLTSGDWLSDNLVSAAQHLMKSRYPNVGGLQNTILQRASSFDVQGSTPFVQCLNLSDSHWITISTLDCPPDTV